MLTVRTYSFLSRERIPWTVTCGSNEFLVEWRQIVETDVELDSIG